MRMQQFWQFLYECNIMPQITAEEVGLCLQEMHRQQAHLLWANHLTTAAQGGATSPETMVEEAQDDEDNNSECASQHENAANGSETGIDNGDIVFNDDDDIDDCTAEDDNDHDNPERGGSSARSTERAHDVKLHDVYEVHQGGERTSVVEGKSG